MKTRLKIERTYIEDEFKNAQGSGLPFKVWLYGDFKMGPTIGAMLEVNPICGDTENFLEYEMLDHEFKCQELDKRLEILYREAAKIVGLSDEEMASKIL